MLAAAGRKNATENVHAGKSARFAVEQHLGRISR